MPHQAVSRPGRNDLRRRAVAASEPPAEEIRSRVRAVDPHIRALFLIGGIESLPQHDGTAVQPLFQEIALDIDRTDLIVGEAAAVAGNKSALEGQLAAGDTHFHVGITQKDLAYPQQHHEEV